MCCELRVRYAFGVLSGSRGGRLRGVVEAKYQDERVRKWTGVL